MSSALAQVKSTPVKQITKPAAATESPGNWKHPRLAEITRRQSRNIFSEKNIRQIVYNVAALVGVGALQQVVLPALPSWVISPVLRQYSSWIYATAVIVPIVNIIFALLPLFRPQDDLSDIPLTPAQRKLLGLPPSSRPDTPASVYSTPPRYSRTPSLAGSPASIKSYTSSPLSNFASPGSGQYSGPGQFSSPRFGSSPSKLNVPKYSPSAVSPLLQKAVGGGMPGARRSSFGPASPLDASTASSLFTDEPSTPTPVTGKRSSVGLNSKWLYEKGRRSSGNSWLHQKLS